MSGGLSLAKGAPLTAGTWEDFVQRLRHDCRGEGVSRHYTADAIFIVEKRTIIFGIDTDFTDDLAVCESGEGREWFSPQEYWDDASEDMRAKLDKMTRDMCQCESSTFLEMSESDQWDLLHSLEYHTVSGWDERWEYVCAHFTHDAAEAFIARKKHDYRKGLRISVEAQTYSWEYNAIKQAIMDGKLVFVEGADK